MKKSKSITFLAILLVSLSMLFGFTSHQDSNEIGAVIILKSYQRSVKKYSFFTTYYGDGNIDTVPLEKVAGFETVDNNYDSIVNELNKLNGLGYELISSTEQTISADIVSTYVLKKVK